MTRPSIIRADTIDLQDQNSPSAQDHSRKLQQGSLAQGPHQAAQIRNAQHDRQVEEAGLSNTWGSVHLSEEPPSEDDDMYAQQRLTGDTLVHNGDLLGPSEESDTENEDDAMNDDLERASSSPSITDGGSPNFPTIQLSTPSTPAPSPSVTPTREDVDDTPDTTLISSSPFAGFISRASNLGEDAEQDASNRSLFFLSKDSSCIDETRRNAPSSSPTVVSRRSSLLLHPLSQRRRSGEYLAQQRRNLASELPSDFMSFRSETKIDLLDLEQDSRPTDLRADTSVTYDLDDEERDQLTPLLSDMLEPQPKKLPPYPDLSNYIQRWGIEELPPIPEEGEDCEVVPTGNTLASEAHPPTPEDFSSSSEAASLIADNEDSDTSSWTTDSDECESFDSFSFDHQDATSFQASVESQFFCCGWGGECLQDAEDIDFDLVYALHNFVATVEGQANAAKGDTMVLLDDSNSYWWLVRVVKDGTIGYLPAEHIETPTERLARLNKHRNIDATKMHFEDSLEKPKNPLRRAIRRRGQKQVSFADPTYRDAPQYDYSTEEEDEDMMPIQIQTNGENSQGQAGQGMEREDDDEITTVAPLNVRQNTRDAPQTNGHVEQIEEEKRGSLDETGVGEDGDRVGPSRSRKGTVRNTDSFFRDDTVETKKITITPRLLRDELGSTTEVVRTSDSRDSGRSGSFDFDKMDAKDDKNSKKKKGMFGIFKRNKNDKKGKNDSQGSGKNSGEFSRDSPVLNSGTSSPAEKLSLESGGSLQRRGSKGKLQKQQPNGQINSPVNSQLNGQVNGQPSGPVNGQINGQINGTNIGQTNLRGGTMSPNGLRPLQLGSDQNMQRSLSDATNNSQRSSPDKTDSSSGDTIRPIKAGMDSPISKVQSPFSDSHSAQKSDVQDSLSESPVHITAEDAHPDTEPPALVRDSSSESDDIHSMRDSPSPPVQAGARSENSNLGPSQISPITPISPLGAFTGAAAVGATTAGAGLLVASRGPPPPTRSPPPQPPGGSSPLDSFASPRSTVTVSSGPDRQSSTSTTASVAPSSAPSTPVWSDASLRAYMDDSGATDIRDLLLLTRDVSGIAPVTPDHPLMAGLYSEERGKVAEMDSALDELLGSWLQRKRSSRAASAMGGAVHKAA